MDQYAPILSQPNCISAQYYLKLIQAAKTEAALQTPIFYLKTNLQRQHEDCSPASCGDLNILSFESLVRSGKPQIQALVLVGREEPAVPVVITKLSRASCPMKRSLVASSQVRLKSVCETSVQQLALSVIKWPSWGAVWPSGWVVTTNPGGRASPGANHLPWEWSKLPHLAGGRSQPNRTKFCKNESIKLNLHIFATRFTF